MQRRFDPVAVAWIICVPVVCVLIGFIVWQMQQGELQKIATLSAQNGTVLCSDSGVEIVRFGQ